MQGATRRSTPTKEEAPDTRGASKSEAHGGIGLPQGKIHLRFGLARGILRPCEQCRDRQSNALPIRSRAKEYRGGLWPSVTAFCMRQAATGMELSAPPAPSRLQRVWYDIDRSCLCAEPISQARTLQSAACSGRHLRFNRLWLARSEGRDFRDWHLRYACTRRAEEERCSTSRPPARPNWLQPDLRPAIIVATSTPRRASMLRPPCPGPSFFACQP